MTEPQFQSSFIPKGPVTTASPLAAQYSKPKTTLMGFLGTLIFVITLILAVGVFAYDRYLLSSIGTMGTELTNARATLQPDTISELVSANKRLQGTRTLLAHHTALSPFFDFLETNTLKNVRYTHFKFLIDSGGYEITMDGQAKSYQDVAAQSDVFNRSGMFMNPVFSDLGLDTKGNVTFTFHATVDPSEVSYEKRLEALPAAVQQAIMATSTATSTSATSTQKTSAATSTKTTAH